MFDLKWLSEILTLFPSHGQCVSSRQCVNTRVCCTNTPKLSVSKSLICAGEGQKGFRPLTLQTETSSEIKCQVFFYLSLNLIIFLQIKDSSFFFFLVKNQLFKTENSKLAPACISSYKPLILYGCVIEWLEITVWGDVYRWSVLFYNYEYATSPYVRF